MSWAKNFEGFLFENTEAKRVCIFPGRFQPFHNGHIAAFKEASQRFSLPVMPVHIFSKNEKSPFSDGLMMNIGKAIEREFPFIEAYVQYPPGLGAYIPDMVKYIRLQYYREPVGLACGADREKTYAQQIKSISSNPNIDIFRPFRLEMVDPRVPGGTSGTEVREAILNDDEALFKKLTPRSVHPFYKEMRKELTR